MTTRDLQEPLTFYEVTSDRWPDFEHLFESKGCPKFCWCMVWRASPSEAKHANGASRKAAMAERVRAGTPVGLLGYAEANRLHGALSRRARPTAASTDIASSGEVKRK